AESWQPHLDPREAANALRMRGREAKDGCPADVLPGRMDRTDVKLFDQEVQVLGRSHAVVLTRPVVRVPEAAQVDRKHTMVCREQWDQLVKGPPGLGKPVDQQDRGP